MTSLDEDQQRFAASEEFAPAFIPIEYLNEYYGQLDEEDAFTARFLAAACAMLPNDLLVQEYGGGPILTAVIPLAPYAREIHFSDYVAACVEETRAWKHAEAGTFDWSDYVRLSLEMEGQTATHEAVAERIALMREKLTTFTHCDARLMPPLQGGAPQYDLVSAQHCLDVAAQHESEFGWVTKNVESLVKPGGYFLIGVTLGTSVYTVGGKPFSRANLKPDDLRHTLLDLGYEILHYDVTPVPNGREYKGICMALGRKA